jgi:uncharacterized membrane protein
MSRKSQNRKQAVRQTLENAPADSIAALIQTTAPDVARKLDPRSLRLLAGEQITQITQHSITATMWGGNVPPPEMLEHYNRLVPNAAERIIAMAEKQGDHRQKLESYVIPSQQMQSARGQLFGFILGLAGIAGAVITGIMGSAMVGVAIAAGSLGVLTCSFVFGKNSQSRQLDSKNKLETPPVPKPSLNQLTDKDD